MSSNSYTLDRFEAGQAIFLKRPEEIEQLIIPRLDIDVEVRAGDIVEITKTAGGYQFHVLHAEKKATEDRIQNILSRLNRK